MNSRSSQNRSRLCSLRNGVDMVGFDRLSEMPDEIIVHILSFLPIVDAVRTVLLRRFGNLWTLLPTLNFSYLDFSQKMNYKDDNLTNHDEHFEPFSRFMRNVLMFHRRFTIDKFRLYLSFECYDESYEKNNDDVKTWLRVALSKEVKKLEFYVRADAFWVESPLLPTFTSQSLVKLELHGCTIGPQHQFHLGSLKYLRLGSVNVGYEGFQNVISGCPSLQELDIVYPISLENLRFTAPNIVKLQLNVECEFEFTCVLDCPNLRILVLNACGYIPEAINLSSVREFTIGSLSITTTCYSSYNGSTVENTGKLKRLLNKLENAEAFELSARASKEFFYVLKNLELAQNKWKRVVCDISQFTESRLLGFCRLVRSLGELEELIVYTSGDPVSKPSSELLPLDLSSPCSLPKLKTVTMHGYECRCEVQLQLIEFLLKSAVVLDIFRIAPGKCELKPVEELEFVNRVSSFPRTSSTARVVFT